jgi:hypothetical protein
VKNPNFRDKEKGLPTVTEKSKSLLHRKKIILALDQEV